MSPILVVEITLKRELRGPYFFVYNLLLFLVVGNVEIYSLLGA